MPKNNETTPDSVDAELREQAGKILGKKPRPDTLWQQLLYMLAREYEADGRIDPQVDAIMQILAQARKEKADAPHEGVGTPAAFGSRADYILHQFRELKKLRNNRHMDEPEFDEKVLALIEAEVAQARKGYVPEGDEVDLAKRIRACFDDFGHDVVNFGKEEDARHSLSRKYIKYIMQEHQAELDQKVAEARIDELKRYQDHYKDDYDNYIAGRIAELTNPHTPPQRCPIADCTLATGHDGLHQWATPPQEQHRES